MTSLRSAYANFLFIFFGLNAKYRRDEPVQSTQYFAIAQASFFLGVLIAIVLGLVYVFLMGRSPPGQGFGLFLFGALYVLNLTLYRCWIGHAEMQRRISEAEPKDLDLAQKKAIILMVVCAPAIMVTMIIVTWWVRG